MLGAVIGDVVGSCYEFNNTRDYHFELFPRRADFTDDSILTLAVADWMLTDAELTSEKLVEKLVEFGYAFPNPTGSYGGGFSTWLFHPEYLEDYRTGKRAGKRCPYNSWGNGSAMRVSAVGWFFDTLRETEQVAAVSAAVTHNHPEGIKGAQAVAAVIFLARMGNSKEAIRDYIEDRYGYDLSDSWEHLHETYRWDSSCQGTVPQAIIAFLESEDYESAIRMAVSMGGDSDTIGCITGAMAEAFYREIPDSMLQHAWKLLPEKLRKVVKQVGMRTAYQVCFRKYEPLLREGRRFTPERIGELKPDEVFVFGSNLQGMHGGGAAAVAYRRFGAAWGVGVGMSGQTYAIPTMQGGVKTIQPYVDEFIDFAAQHPRLKFLVTRIGCGIAGFRDEQIAPLFEAALPLQNVILPRSFYRVIMEMKNR